MRRRTTSTDTPAMARCACEGARLGSLEPHIRGARSHRGKDFKGRYVARGRAHAAHG